jgi:hypothetical protein
MPENGFPVFKAEFGTSIKNPGIASAKNLKVYPSNGWLLFETLAPASVWVYNIAGALVARLDVQTTGNTKLPQGVYVVKSVAKGIVESVKVKL